MTFTPSAPTGFKLLPLPRYCRQAELFRLVQNMPDKAVVVDLPFVPVMDIQRPARPREGQIPPRDNRHAGIHAAFCRRGEAGW